MMANSLVAGDIRALSPTATLWIAWGLRPTVKRQYGWWVLTPGL